MTINPKTFITRFIVLIWISLEMIEIQSTKILRSENIDEHYSFMRSPKTQRKSSFIKFLNNQQSQMLQQSIPTQKEQGSKVISFINIAQDTSRLVNNVQTQKSNSEQQVLGQQNVLYKSDQTENQLTQLSNKNIQLSKNMIFGQVPQKADLITSDYEDSNYKQPLLDQLMALKQNINQDSIILDNQKVQQYQNTKAKPKAFQNRKFDGLILFHDVPLVFYQKEVFQIRGELFTPAGKGGIYINFILRKRSNAQRFSYSHFIKPEATHFNFKINFKGLEGKFYLSFFAGYQGSTDSKVYQVQSEIPNFLRLSMYGEIPRYDKILQQKHKRVDKPQKPSGFRIDIANNKVKLCWNLNYSIPLHRLFFVQGNFTVEYLLSNFINSFDINEADFWQFKKGKVMAQLSAAYSQGIGFTDRNSQFSQVQTITFEAFMHHYSEFNSNLIELQIVPWKIQKKQIFNIKGKSLNEISNKMWILNPNNTFRIEYLNENISKRIISQNQSIDKQISFQQIGVHIVEINKATGGAALNRAIYVGQAFPVLPDVFDLSQKQFAWKRAINRTENSLIDIGQEILTFFQLINLKREEFKANKLVIQDELNGFAVGHSKDMMKNQFFNHVNLQKLTPQKRAQKVGIKLKVGQNIVMNINLTQAHYKLCRSPVHLQNMVDPEQFSMGLGIAYSQYGIFYVTQQFTVRNFTRRPLDEEQYRRYQSKIAQIVMSQTVQIQKQNLGLSKIMQNQLRMQNFTTKKLGFKLVSLGYTKFSLGNIKLVYSTKILDRIRGKRYFKSHSSEFKSVSVGLIPSEQQYLNICVIFI